MIELLERSASPGLVDGGKTKPSLRALHWVVRHHAQLHGFRLAPLGFTFLASGLWRAGSGSWLPATATHHARGWFAGGVAIALAASLPIRRRYWRRFGRPTSHTTWRDVGILTLFTAGFVAAIALQPAGWRVSLPALYIGAALLHPVLMSNGWRWHYIPIAVGWFLFGVTSLLGFSVHARSAGLDLLIGISLLVVGIGDDRLLRRTLAPVKKGCV